MEGIALCARYAFGPNRLHMCGPDMSREVLAYISEGEADGGLTHILKQFQTLFPYLQEIARVNNIRDPFDPRVVLAYWIGNELLDNIPVKNLYRHLVDNLEVKKGVGLKSFGQIEEGLRFGAFMHHSYHVFNIWKRTGHLDIAHTLQSMDQCRISSGKVLSVDGAIIKVLRKPLILKNDKLVFGDEEETKIMRRLEDSSIIDEVKSGDMISMHWGVPCTILTENEVKNLEKYTNQSLALANQFFRRSSGL